MCNTEGDRSGVVVKLGYSSDISRTPSDEKAIVKWMSGSIILASMANIAGARGRLSAPATLAMEAEDMEGYGDGISSLLTFVEKRRENNKIPWVKIKCYECRCDKKKNMLKWKRRDRTKDEDLKWRRFTLPGPRAVEWSANGAKPREIQEGILAKVKKVCGGGERE